MFNFFKGAENESLYSFSTNLDENPFGVQLLSVCADVYDNIDEAMEAIVEGVNEAGHVEISEDDLEGLMTGEYLPSREFLLSLQDLFVEVDEDGNEEFLEDEFAKLVSSAAAAKDLADAAEAELASELTGDEFEGQDQEGVINPYLPTEVQESLKGKSDQERELEELRAQVAAQAERNQITESLDQVVEYASHLVKEGKLPPVAFSYMLGKEGRTSASRYAEFSSFCQEQEIPGDVHLGQIAYALSVFENCLPNVDFSVYSDESFSTQPASKPDVADADAIKAMFKAYKQSK